MIVLLEWAVRTLAIGAIAALLLAAFRVRRAAVRHAVWTTVLLAGFLMPVLGRMLPQIAWSLPIVVPPAAPLIRQDIAPASSAARNTPAVQFSVKHDPPAHLDPLPPRFESPPPSQPSWQMIMVAVYVGGAGILAFRIVLGWMLTRRLLRTCSPVQDAGLHRPGLRNAPAIVETPLTVVPMTMSGAKPVIVLPAEWRTWSPATLHAVLIHEVAHVVRRDALVQQLSLIYRAAFWFNPFAWWLHRALTNLAEDASDETVLEHGVDRTLYAEIVLGFFAELKAHPRRAHWPALAMAQGRNAARRIERILAWSARGRAMRISLAFASVVAAMAPVIAIAAAVHPEATSVGSIPSIASPWRPAPVPAPREAPEISDIRALHTAEPAQTTAQTQSATPRDARSLRIDGVSVAVRARDAQGREVTDLTAADVHLFEDGVEQRIDVFLAFAGGHAVQPGTAPTTPALPSNRLFVVFIDDANIERADFPQLVSVLQSIRNNLRDGDLVSIVSTGYSSIEVDATYDRDHARFNQAIAKLASVDPASPSRFAAGRDPYVVHTALRTASDVVKHVGQLKDWKKAFIYISGGYDTRPFVSTAGPPIGEADLVAEMAALIRSAVVNNMTSYSITPRGVAAGSDSMVASLQALATNTGGFLIGSQAELSAGLQRIGLEPGGVSFYYLVGYTTSNHDLSKSVRTIEVRVGRPGLRLDYRREYTIRK